MPFNSALFITIIAWAWGAGALCHICNVWIAKTDKEKFSSLIAAIVMLIILGACLVL